MHLRRPFAGLLLAGSVAFLVACQQPPPPEPVDTRAADEAAIRATSAGTSQAAAAKDLEKLLSFFADDAVVLPSDAPLVSGKDAIRQVWSEWMATPGYALSLQTTRVEVGPAGALAYEMGTYEFTHNDPEGNPVTTIGKYLTVLKKQADGSWKVAVTMSNRDG